MKKLVALLIGSVLLVSCQKETNINSSIPPELPTGKQTLLIDDPNLTSIIQSSPQYDRILAQGANINDATIIHYGDVNKVCILFKNNDEYKWSMVVYKDVIYNTNKLEVSLDSSCTGNIKVFTLSDSLVVEGNWENGVFKPVWTSHGGFGSWEECVKHHATEPWGLIMLAALPLPTALGISLGCL